mgnify:CR=1 FL=1
MSEVFLADLDENSANKVAEWKSDNNLSELIMSEFKLTTIETAKDWIRKNSKMDSQILRGIYVKDKESLNRTVELVGVCRLMFIDFESRICELGIYIGNKSFRGRGIGEKAILLLLNIAFRDLKLRKVFLKVNNSNKPAVNLYKKIGFTIEGVLKEHYKSEKGYEDINYMSFFEENWK